MLRTINLAAAKTRTGAESVGNAANVVFEKFHANGRLWRIFARATVAKAGSAARTRPFLMVALRAFPHPPQIILQTLVRALHRFAPLENECLHNRQPQAYAFLRSQQPCAFACG